MTPGAASERWRRVEELLNACLERDPAERERFLNDACSDDRSLRDEVASLLAAHDRHGPLDRLAADVAPLGARLHASPTSLAGRAVGHYRVLEQVGGGGMGVVYKALDTRLGRTVALKFLQARFGPDDSAAERFRLEARTVAALEHPNICTVHEIGETDDGQLYLAMPLYDGETLQQRIARGPLPIAEAATIAAQIARGLAKAHARGIIHRDIKPSNVFLTSDGVVKLLDFGIAKLADVTLTGSAASPLGTVAYMSPEQARGERLDHRTDIWSLGVVLYEMLAGERPFPGGAAAVVLAGVLEAEPAPVRSHRPDVPPGLERVVMTALTKPPDVRYQSVQALESDLQALGLGVVTSGESRPPDGVTGGVRAQHTHHTYLRRSWRVVGLAVAAMAVVAAGIAAWIAARDPEQGSSPSATATAPATIAVLPFVDRSPDRDQDYFSDGISEELIATLARIDGLRVASRTSAFAFKGRDVDVRTVGAQLGVSTVLEGSVRRAGDKLRITAQLVNVADGFPLWSETYDRTAGDAFAIQEDIARSIAQTLRVRLVGAAGNSSGGGAPDPEAYDLYLKGRHALYLRGRYAWYTRTEEGLRSAAAFFEQAVAQAPSYARAHSGLADAYAVLGFYDYLPPGEAFPKAEAAAKRAIALDGGLAAPHATLGYVELYHNWNFQRAEEEFRLAIALEPNYSTAHQWYANLLTAAGRMSEAEVAMRRAQEIDPLSLIASAALGWVFYHAGNHSAALAQLEQTLGMNADYAVAHLWRGWTLQEMDSLPAAVAAHRRAVAVTDSGALYIASLARSLALGGARSEAEALLARLEVRADSGRYVPSYELAKVHLALGRSERALELLERARAEQSHSMVFLRVDPQLADLRDEARFKRLVEQVF
ncbi:MAG TPA: protein kinase [Gemmatimonadaceae bacterium]|nr:protein kinase [Gemmatimonadaceae bacterium]